MRSPRRVSRDETSPVSVTSAVIVTETAARMTCPSPPAACTDIAPCQVGAGVPSPKCRVNLVPLPRHPAGSPLGSPLHRQQLRREPVLGGAHRPGAGPERAAARRLHCSVLLQVTSLQCGLFCSLLAVGVLAILSRGLIDNQLQASTLARYKPVQCSAGSTLSGVPCYQAAEGVPDAWRGGDDDLGGPHPDQAAVLRGHKPTGL